MRLSELSEHSGVSTATIKYYLREGLLPAGRRITATQADYGEEHLRRLRLVRALIQVGKVPVSTAREVLAYVDDDSLGHTVRMGAAMWTLPQPSPEVEADEAESTSATRELETMLETLGWSHVREIGALSPVYRALVSGIVMLHRLDCNLPFDSFLTYARKMQELAVMDMEQMENDRSELEQVELAIASSVIFEPLLLSLRRLAQEEEAARRYGT